jgi:hypothetical protein
VIAGVDDILLSIIETASKIQRGLLLFRSQLSFGSQSTPRHTELPTDEEGEEVPKGPYRTHGSLRP